MKVQTDKWLIPGLGFLAFLGAGGVMLWDLQFSSKAPLVLEKEVPYEYNAAIGTTKSITFAFRNLSGRTLRVSKIKTSCICVQPVLQSTRIPPGECGVITTSATVPPGQTRGWVMALFEGEDFAFKYDFALNGFYPRGLHLAPKSVRMGPSGGTLTVSLRLILGEASPLSARAIPAPRCEGPSDVVIEKCSDWRPLARDNEYTTDMTLRISECNDLDPTDQRIEQFVVSIPNFEGAKAAILEVIR